MDFEKEKDLKQENQDKKINIIDSNIKLNKIVLSGKNTEELRQYAIQFNEQQAILREEQENNK